MMLKSFECWLNISCVCLWWSGVKPDEAFVFFFGLCCDQRCFCLQGQSRSIPPAEQRSCGRVFLTDWKPLYGPSPLGYVQTLPR